MLKNAMFPRSATAYAYLILKKNIINNMARYQQSCLYLFIFLKIFMGNLTFWNNLFFILS